MNKAHGVMASLLKIDGSLGEGGGQVLRIALSLSALYRIPVEIINIRAGRPKPGLSAQHLKGVELVKQMCNARVTGTYIGSTRLEFWPESLHNCRRELYADIHTAGCITLLAQVALPCALFVPGSTPITLILKGGTNVPMGPSIEYLTEVFRPLLNKFGADFDFTVVKRGYFPKGGGEVHLRIQPVEKLNAVMLLEPGQPVSISGWAYVAGTVNINEANRMADDAKKTITEKLDDTKIPVPPINIETYREDRTMAVGNGSGINIVCRTSTDCVFGGSGLGPSTQTPAGITAANEILVPVREGACVDEHTQDQMIILMTLASGKSKVRTGARELTCHTQTAIQVAELMLGHRGLRFQFSKEHNKEEDPPSYTLECIGLGLTIDDSSNAS
ncbi:RNA 3'-terminal phosphate cyclase isoform X1 [Neodiprion pinetum]|uniref:RNA 3'-terminal phosphate cyclase isoform X1 n=2 Tax=Neodiprion TaxID=270857 RepID=UPI001EDDA56C|nr:RNA 3'-terminal phosphate cyclase isoform X1 [Neodiprion pinetum]